MLSLLEKFVFAILFLCGSLKATIPFFFHYSGVLIDSLGKPLSVDENVVFALYDNSKYGNKIWEEIKYINSKNGVISVLLGDSNSINEELLYGKDSLFLEISRESGSFSKRIRIGSVFFASISNFSDSSITSCRSDTSTFSHIALIADSVRNLPKLDTSRYSFFSKIADSARASGSNVWNKVDSNLFFMSGNIGIGIDSLTEKLNICGGVLINNDSGDSRLVLKSSSLASIEFKSSKYSNSGNLVKLVPYNGEFFINMWDKDGENERIGVVTFRHTGVVLEARGNIQADNFVANGQVLNVPDYVFSDCYDLMSLADLDIYLKKHHHLPNIPSRKEIQKQGLNLTEMNLRLLEKIEELTLYILKQNRRIESLEKIIEYNNRPKPL